MKIDASEEINGFSAFPIGKAYSFANHTPRKEPVARCVLITITSRLTIILQHPKTGRANKKILHTAQTPDKTPSNKNHGDRPSEVFLRMILTCCGTYDATIPIASPIDITRFAMDGS